MRRPEGGGGHPLPRLRRGCPRAVSGPVWLAEGIGEPGDHLAHREPGQLFLSGREPVDRRDPPLVEAHGRSLGRFVLVGYGGHALPVVITLFGAEDSGPLWSKQARETLAVWDGTIFHDETFHDRCWSSQAITDAGR